MGPSLHVLLRCDGSSSTVVKLPPSAPLEGLRQVAAAQMRVPPSWVRLWGDLARAGGTQLLPWATVQATVDLRGGMSTSTQVPTHTHSILPLILSLAIDLLRSLRPNHHPPTHPSFAGRLLMPFTVSDGRERHQEED